ncbi:hypothetical protein BT96DRAFT_996150 [Gymnopus androsaceus JB14]|uniref:Uncharacterized protein n=1 Tax=Gymnopus androsaceus JB14 TaxID=1447944 RepID=A0A6A4HF59_9AGAR|nr:hypothetical protein BT96DRAFT_996150 [Gymnopus androsaceus JB14]
MSTMEMSTRSRRYLRLLLVYDLDAALTLENAFEEYATPPKKAEERHTFRPDGLVDFELIDRAQKTYEDIVVPLQKALTKWWDYVQANDVQLPDEYDQIYHDLALTII